MRRIIACLWVLLAISAAALGASQKVEKEERIMLADHSGFTASAGWQFDSTLQKLSSPEGDLAIYFFTKPYTGKPEELSRNAWKSVRKDFALKVLQIASPPSRNGWEEAHEVIYDVPARENRTVLSGIRVFKGKAYLLLVDGSNAALERRGAQIQIVADSWRPEGLKKEDLSHRPAKELGPREMAELDRFIKKAIRMLNVPGAAVEVLQKGKAVYRKGFGVKQVGMPGKVTPDTLFMIGSTTKPLTTLMQAKLVESGKLSWETPIQKALPAFALADPEITPKFLMKHTACACTGMPRRDLDFVFEPASPTAEAMLGQLRSLKPTTGFGETFQYSNHLVAVGGYAAANVYNVGKDLFGKYENAMRDLVFAPLEMANTRVKPTAGDAGKLASPHARRMDGRMVPFPQSIDDMVYPVAPAGSVWSTVDDISRYVGMELRKGKDPQGKQLYAEDQLLKRRAPGVKVDEDTRYGLGLFVEDFKGVKVIHHGGNTLGFTSDMFFLPDHDVGMVSLTNASSVNGFRAVLKQKLLEILFAAEPKAEEMLRFMAGVQAETRAKARARISLKGGELKWVSRYVGKFANPELGPIEIRKSGKGFAMVAPRWTSEIGSAKERGGEKLMVLTSPPWGGGMEFHVEPKPRKIILDDAQMKYEFVESK